MVSDAVGMNPSMIDVEIKYYSLFNMSNYYYLIYCCILYYHAVTRGLSNLKC